MKQIIKIQFCPNDYSFQLHNLKHTDQDTYQYSKKESLKNDDVEAEDDDYDNNGDEFQHRRKYSRNELLNRRWYK
ncbi:unnamed protein product (macronuclear) [Paramecium tetraurelia]|uniref:Uncharacterized protein n=1 Tax=Paramecium tetraurelia TaxID=5888 RepID=A0CUJ4_PARTE|nr:uncharacterized protein GSPATT00010661001 [Paramecium tetraurelia]CAK74461.1 unnamed protein product [Paramecium tetraurelia]|eukprot:XP_001441858.1 hypothetical protein (macronuclear) [Paramecium tetraurelia strain d4-2]